MGIEVPSCRNCGNELLLFLQFDIDESWSLPFKSKSHLVMFMCPKCNEIPSFDACEDGRLPDQFWEKTEGHFFAALTMPTSDERVLPQQPTLMPKKLRFEPFRETGHASDEILVGGDPYWLQEPERFICNCGTELALVTQIAENLGFQKQAGAPEQKDSFSQDDYCLFLGNEIYIFACPSHCDPRAVWITVQG